MGVLKVNVGDAVTPDWRHIGCPAITVVAAVGGHCNSGSSFNTDLPAAPAEDDVLIATLNISQYLATRSVSTPAGWTQQVDSTSGEMRLYVFTKVCGPSEIATLPWSVSGSNENHTGVVVQYRGATMTGFQSAVAGPLTASGPGMPITCQGQNYGSAFLSGSDYVSEPGWTTDYDERPPYHDTFMGHGPFVGSGDVIDPGVVFNNAPAPPASYWRYANLLLPASPVSGRLKLWDGTRWMREVCDNDAGPTFTDDFNRADSSTSVSNASWVQWNSAGAPNSSYPWGLRSGNAYANGPANGVDNILYYDVGTTDYDFTVTYTGASGRDYGVGLVFSMDTASGGTYRLWTNNGIAGRDGGTGLGMIVTGYPSIVAGDVLRITCVGTTITLRLNGTVVDTVTNSWATTGGATRVGLYSVFGDIGGQWDDVTIIAGIEKHPLNVWDGTTWQLAACMTPA